MRQNPDADIEVEHNRTQRPDHPWIGVKADDRFAVDVEGENRCGGKSRCDATLSNDFAIGLPVSPASDAALLDQRRVLQLDVTLDESQRQKEEG
jgi:hypothetical protein